VRKSGLFAGSRLAGNIDIAKIRQPPQSQHDHGRHRVDGREDEVEMRAAGSAGFGWARLAGASLFLWIGSSQAETNAIRHTHDHDGTFAVHGTTRHGSCQKTFNTKFGVNGGHLHAIGYDLVRVSGHIGSNGKVTATLRLLHHSAHATGWIHGPSGSGSWSSAGLGCNGHWHARRQG
jgi:hypothetical protein